MVVPLPTTSSHSTFSLVIGNHLSQATLEVSENPLSGQSLDSRDTTQTTLTALESVGSRRFFSPTEGPENRNLSPAWSGESFSDNKPGTEGSFGDFSRISLDDPSSLRRLQNDQTIAVIVAGRSSLASRFQQAISSVWGWFGF